MIVATNSNTLVNAETMHIAFAYNVEGLNRVGILNVISTKYWPELQNMGYHKLGTVLSKKIGNISLHALVCYSLRNGWSKNQEDIIRICFNGVESEGLPVATYDIGTEYQDQIGNADFSKIVSGMAKSTTSIILHSNFSKKDLNAIIEESKRTEITKKEAEQDITINIKLVEKTTIPRKKRNSSYVTKEEKQAKASNEQIKAYLKSTTTPKVTPPSLYMLEQAKKENSKDNTLTRRIKPKAIKS